MRLPSSLFIEDGMLLTIWGFEIIDICAFVATEFIRAKVSRDNIANTELDNNKNNRSRNDFDRLLCLFCSFFIVSQANVCYCTRLVVIKYRPLRWHDEGRCYWQHVPFFYFQLMT